MPINVLDSLVNIYGFLDGLNIDDIPNNICQIYHYFIQLKHDKNSNLYVSTTGSLLQLIYVFQRRGNSQHFRLGNADTTTFELTTKKEKNCRHLCQRYVYMSPVHLI